MTSEFEKKEEKKELKLTIKRDTFTSRARRITKEEGREMQREKLGIGKESIEA